MILNRYFHGYDLCIFFIFFVAASIVLLISLFRGLTSHSQSIYLIPSDLLQRTYRTLQYIEEIDKDELTRYHARIGISDLDVISQRELFGKVD